MIKRARRRITPYRFKIHNVVMCVVCVFPSPNFSAWDFCFSFASNENRHHRCRRIVINVRLMLVHLVVYRPIGIGGYKCLYTYTIEKYECVNLYLANIRYTRTHTTSSFQQKRAYTRDRINLISIHSTQHTVHTCFVWSSIVLCYIVRKFVQHIEQHIHYSIQRFL